MMIYNKDGIRVMQHPHLQIYNVQQYMEGDWNRSYSRKMDYFTVKQCNSIEEVNTVVQELISAKVQS